MSKALHKVVFAAALLVCVPLHAAAQGWGLTAVGVGEFDTEHGKVLLAALTASQRGMGLHPQLGVQVSHIGFESGTTDVSVNSVRPFVGLRNGFNGGDMNLNIGYAFGNRDDDAVAPVVVGSSGGDTEDGAVLSGGVEYWGTGGPLGAQALASYNFGGSSLWTRGRVTTRLSSLSNGGQLRVGGEVAYMHGDGYSIVQPGGVVQWHQSSNGVIVIGGVGVKIPDGGDNATYVKAELVVPIH
jgi:hypothetical protein